MRQKWPLCDLVRGGCVAGGDGAAEDAAVVERERRGRCAANGGYAALVPCATERSKGSATVNFMRKLEGQTPRKAHFLHVRLPLTIANNLPGILASCQSLKLNDVNPRLRSLRTNPILKYSMLVVVPCQ